MATEEDTPSKDDGTNPNLAAALSVLAAIRRGAPAIPCIVLAVRHALFALAHPIYEKDRVTIDELVRALAAVTPIVAQAAAPKHAAESIYLGIGALSGILREVLKAPADREPVALGVARVNHAALVASELDVTFRRAAIERGGDLLRRRIRMGIAERTVPAGLPN